ncbi:MAG: hypothetical protein V4552_02050 [Pseudomonadota bacterium]
MTKKLKKCCDQSTLFSIGMIFCSSLLAENISLEQYQLLHQNQVLTFKSTGFPNRTSQVDSSKFVTGGKGFKHNNVLKNSHVPKNSYIIDHQIFASPKNIKSTKRIFI